MVRLDHLQRDGSINPQLARPIHHTHSAPGNFLKQLVIAEIAGLGASDGRFDFGTGEFLSEQCQAKGATRAREVASVLPQRKPAFRTGPALLGRTHLPKELRKISGTLAL